jgi:hypothetical protein
MRRIMLVLAALGLFGMASASALADDIVGPQVQVYAPSPVGVVNPVAPAPGGWYVARPYRAYYPSYAPWYYGSYYYSYPSFAYPAPVYPAVPYSVRRPVLPGFNVGQESRLR